MCSHIEGSLTLSIFISQPSKLATPYYDAETGKAESCRRLEIKIAIPNSHKLTGVWRARENRRIPQIPPMFTTYWGLEVHGTRPAPPLLSSSPNSWSVRSPFAPSAVVRRPSQIPPCVHEFNA